VSRRAEPKRPKTTLIALILAAIVGMGAIVWTLTGGAGRGMATEPVEVAWGDDPQRLLALAQGVTTGNADAPVTIMEFADYSCPHCREFDESVQPRIDLTYLQSGKAKFVFHDLVLGSFPHSFLAARAARCAGDQQKYMEYHDVLFRNQPVWSMSRTVPADQLVDYAQELGLDAETFEGCLRSYRHAEVVSANGVLAAQLNLNRTPSVLIRSPGSTLPDKVGDNEDYWLGIVSRVDQALGDLPTATPSAPAPPQP
jgi:protein-disulfide isomerase